VIQRGERLRLALEARSDVRLTGDVRRQDLDGDRALQARVARAVDFAL